VSGLNVIMRWFMLCLLLGLMFRECFVINEILVLITVKNKKYSVTGATI